MLQYAFKNYLCNLIVWMPLSRRGPCFVFSSMRLHGCLCRQLSQKKYIFSFGVCLWHADGNHSGCGYLSVRKMCGFYRFFCIPACPWQRADKGAHPSQVSYRRNAHMGILSNYPGTGRNPLCHRPAGSAICTGSARAVAPIYHPVAGLADGRTILVNCNFIWDGFWLAGGTNFCGDAE